MLPRVVGTDAEGVEITAERPLRPVPEEGHGLAVAHRRGAAVHDHAGGGALAIYAQPKQRGRAAAKPPLKELAPTPSARSPVAGDGRFGSWP